MAKISAYAYVQWEVCIVLGGWTRCVHKQIHVQGAYLSVSKTQVFLAMPHEFALSWKLK